VATETQNSVAVFVLWGMVLIFSLTTGYLISGIGIVGTFSLFATVTILGGIYFIFKMENTEGLTSSQCKQAYWPKDLQQVSESYGEV